MGTSRVSLSDLLLYGGSRPLLAATLACLAVSGALGALTPRLMAGLGDAYGTDAFSEATAGLLWLFVGTYANRALYLVVLTRYIQGLVLHARGECFSRWLLSYDVQTGRDAASERYPQGEVIARVISDTESIRELMTSGAFGIVIDGLFVATALGSFVAIDDRLGPLLAGFLASSSLLLFWGSRFIREVFHGVRRARGRVQRTIANLIGGLGEFHYTDNGGYAQKKGGAVFQDFLRRILRANVWDAGYYSLAESLYPLTLLFVVLVLPRNAGTDAAIVLVTVDLIQRAIHPIKDIASKIANVQRALVGLAHINGFFADLAKGRSSPLEPPPADDAPFERLRARIGRFAYPRPPGDGGGRAPFSLEDVRLEEGRGRLVGVVGLSGSGKSTLLGILAGDIVPDDFELTVSWDGGELRYGDKSLERGADYRRYVGLVSQDSHVFSESLRFNVTMGTGTEAEFLEFWDWVRERIPYLSHWGRGPLDPLDQGRLSAGQKQLVAGLRSCFLKKRVVLFDEVASGLDGELEAALRETIRVVQARSLAVIVAHRVETLMDADRILVMDGGRVAASGVHGELARTSPIYRDFLGALDGRPAGGLHQGTGPKPRTGGTP